MILATVQTIWDLLSEMIKSILQIDTIFYVGLGFVLLMTAFIFIKSSLSYESKLTRSVNRLNNWLLKNRTINEQNLVEFNKLIKSKKCPVILRKHWQQYMLYRDKMPSEYISTYNCIDKPSKTSSFTSNIKNYISIYKITALISFFFSLIAFSGKSDSSIIYYVSMTLVTPSIIMLIGVIFTLILRSVQNHNLADLYQTFHIFTRYIDKASATIPKYVDFEILFTQREIKDGIPILGEYLEKRARQEQEELEEAQRNAVAHEEYNFAESGVDGSLMLERAMKESETYLNAKQRIYAEIQQFESEISTLQKNYENTSKDYQRKLQASKENMERLRQQQEESTNRIEINYIRKQQQDEVKKQEQLEKDQDDATNKFNTEINSLTAEIEKRKQDLELKRLKVQEAMESEYQTFAVKLHKTISGDIEKENDANIQKINIEKEQYAQAITYLKGEVDNKDQIIMAKDQVIAELTTRLEMLAKGEGISEPTSENADNLSKEVTQEQLQQETPESTQEQPYEQVEESTQEQPYEQVEESTQEDGHYDDKGYYWFNDGTYYDNKGLYHDIEGNVYDSEGNLQAINMPIEVEIKPQTEENQEASTSEPIEEVNVEREQTEEIKNEHQVDEVEQQIVEEQPQEEQNINNDDATSEIIQEEQIETQYQNETENTNLEQEKQASIDIGYDEVGNYKYSNGTYYDTENLYHDLDGKVYNTEGVFIKEEEVITKEPQPDQQKEEELQSIEESAEVQELPEQPIEEATQENTENSEVTPTEEQNEDPSTQENINTEPTEEIKSKQEEQQLVAEEQNNEQISEQLSEEKEDVQPKENLEENLDNINISESVEEIAEEISENNSEDQSKRKVGRPRKEKSEEELNKPKRSVGRPRKEKSEEELNKPKRSVGRPRKEKSEAQEETKPKRRAGRPKKEKTEEEQSTEILKHLGQSLLDLSEQKAKENKSSKKTEE